MEVETDNFHITLPSNVSSINLYPENSIQNYYTKLAKRIRLNGEWEVGLSEISFTNSFYNINNPQSIKLYDRTRSYDNEIKIQPGRYNSIELLLETINSILKTYEKDYPTVIRAPQFYLEKESRRVYVTYGLSQYRIDDSLLQLIRQEGLTPPKLPPNEEYRLSLHMGSEIALMLGFRPSGHALNSKVLSDKIYIRNIADVEPLAYHKDIHTSNEKPPPRGRSDTVYDLNAGYHSIFVYTNIIDSVLVGDSLVPLLKVCEVPSNSKFGDQIVIRYDRPLYVPVQARDFDTIEIDIKDDTGSPIKFNFGRVIATFHFRKKSL